jgi:hypothetical protein
VKFSTFSALPGRRIIATSYQQAIYVTPAIMRKYPINDSNQKTLFLGLREKTDTGKERH